MKNGILVLLFLLVILIVVGCSVRKTVVSAPSPSEGLESLRSKLEAAGYYMYVDAAKVEEVKAEAMNTGYIFGGEDTKRDYMSDAEDLAEGGIGDFFETIKPFLATQNVKLVVSDENFSDKGYKIKVNGIEYEIYSEQESQAANVWELTANRSFAIINDSLIKAGSLERIYILYGGNDLRAIFLTEDMYKLISESKELPAAEKPKPVKYATNDIVGTYFYDDEDDTPELKEDHYMVFESHEGKITGYYYGTSDDFDSAREGYYPGFYVSQMLDLSIGQNTVGFSLNLYPKDLFSSPVELKYKHSEDVPSDHTEWDNAQIFDEEKGLIHTYEAKIEKGNLVLKTEDGPRIFKKIK